MPLTTSPARAEQTLIGKALRLLREARGMTQADLGASLPKAMTAQAWSKYESGERKFTRDRMQQILDILQATPQDLADAKAAVLNPDAKPRPANGFAERPASFIIDVYGRPQYQDGEGPAGGGRRIRSLDLRTILGPGVDAVEMADDSMVPWAEPGELVFYDRDRTPKFGAGCVIETTTGDFYVKKFEKSDRMFFYFKELYPEERITSMPRQEIRGVYAIRLRGD